MAFRQKCGPTDARFGLAMATATSEAERYNFGSKSVKFLGNSRRNRLEVLAAPRRWTWGQGYDGWMGVETGLNKMRYWCTECTLSSSEYREEKLLIETSKRTLAPATPLFQHSRHQPNWTWTLPWCTRKKWIFQMAHFFVKKGSLHGLLDSNTKSLLVFPAGTDQQNIASTVDWLLLCFHCQIDERVRQRYDGNGDDGVIMTIMLTDWVDPPYRLWTLLEFLWLPWFFRRKQLGILLFQTGLTQLNGRESPKRIPANRNRLRRFKTSRSRTRIKCCFW